VGLSGIFGKLITESAFFIVFSRMLLAAIVIALFLLFKKRNFTFVRLNDKIKLVWLGLLLAIHWSTFFLSIQISSVAIGLLSFSSFPIFTTILEPIFDKKKILSKNILISIIVFIGLIIVVPEYDFSNNIFQGIIVGVISGLSYSLLSIYNKKIVRNVNPTVLVMYQNFFGLLFLSPSLLFIQINLSSQDFVYILVLGLICTALAHTLFVRGLKYISAHSASIIAGLEPIYGILLAYFLLGEAPGIRSLIGGTIIISGVILNSFYKIQATN